MTWVAAGVAAVGLITTVVGAATASDGTPTGSGSSTSKVEFPEETRRLFGDLEEPLLKGSLGEQQNLLAPLLGGFQTRDAAQQKLGIARGQTMALTAAQRGAESSGIMDFGPIEDSLQGLSPDLLAGLKQLVLQRGQKINSVVPAGYAGFFAPSTSNASQSQAAGPSEFDTGFAIAKGLANVAGAYYGGGGTITSRGGGVSDY